MKVPFAPPMITEAVRAQVEQVLESGWITTGPKVQALERAFSELTQTQAAIAVNSWSSGALLALKWLGIRSGDEIIIPAYTYTATALSVMHAGGSVTMCDVDDDFLLNPEHLRSLISARTKAIIPVDFAGLPADYSAIKQIARERQHLFEARSRVQKELGRPLIMADAAHSFGATIAGRPAALTSDIAIFSTHAVKNLTTAEGGVIVLNLPESFDLESENQWFILNRLHGQTNDAFSKSQSRAWRYDVVYDGMKLNMPDICAAIGLGQLPSYPESLSRRAAIHDMYDTGFSNINFITPKRIINDRLSACHLYALRLAIGKEEDRDQIIQMAAEAEIALNVHFIPLPMLTLFRRLGYKSSSVPNSVRLFSREMSLPIYPQMSDAMIQYVIDVVSEACKSI